jgi:hypothetical protein
VTSRYFSLRSSISVAALVLAMSGSAWAGPPFATDDPEPTEYGTFENYLFSEAIRFNHQTTGTAVGLEINYGAFPDTQTSATIPLTYAPGDDGKMQYGPGPLLLGVKYRFIEEDDDGWRPQVAFYPQVNIPLDRQVGTTNVNWLLPIWAQKSFGPWTTFGGGGYWINPGPGNQNYYFVGWAILRQVTPNLHLGAEIFHQSASFIHEASQTSYNGALLYDFSDHWHIVASAGSGIIRAEQSNQFSYYLGLEWTT